MLTRHQNRDFLSSLLAALVLQLLCHASYCGWTSIGRARETVSQVQHRGRCRQCIDALMYQFPRLKIRGTINAYYSPIASVRDDVSTYHGVVRYPQNYNFEEIHAHMTRLPFTVSEKSKANPHFCSHLEHVSFPTVWHAPDLDRRMTHNSYKGVPRIVTNG